MASRGILSQDALSRLTESVERELHVYDIASASVPLITADSEKYMPQSYGSGMLFKDGDVLFLLTAYHNVMLHTTIIQGYPVHHPEGLRMRNMKTDGWPILRATNLNPGANGEPYLDASYAVVPANDTYVRFNVEMDHVHAYPVRRFVSDDVFKVGQDDPRKYKYSFCGTIEPVDDKNPPLIDNAAIDVSKFTIASGLEFIPDRAENDYSIYFKLPESYLKLGARLGGTSGTPILSEDGRVIGMVCGGDEDDPSIVRGIRIDTLLDGIRNHQIVTLPHGRERDVDVLSSLLCFLDKDQRDFYWHDVQEDKVL